MFDPSFCALGLLAQRTGFQDLILKEINILRRSVNIKMTSRDGI